MKRFNHLPAFILMFLSLSMVFSARIVLGQEPEKEKQVKIKIIKKENGETETIDKTFRAGDNEELRNILEEHDIEYDLEGVNEDEEVEIIIKKKKQGAVEDEVAIGIDRFEDEDIIVAKRAFLGVFFKQPSETAAREQGLPSNKGVVITEIVEGSAAQKAGLQAGDFISKIDDKQINNKLEFIEAIRSHDPNDEVEIVYYREGKKKSTKATLEEREYMKRFHAKPYEDVKWHSRHPGFHKGMDDPEKRPFLGITFDPAEENGIKIDKVIEGTTAEKAGLKKGDAIKKINRNPVNNLPELKEELNKAEIGENVEIEYQREGELEIAKAPMQSKAACKAFKFGPEKMQHCFDYKMMHENAEIDKVQLKKHIEKKIEILEQRLEMLEKDLSDGTEETEEVEITISLEDISDREAAGLKTSEDDLEIEKLSFSPNPNNGRFTLDFYLPEKGKTDIRIIDVNNKEIYTETLNRFSGQYTKQIDISENPKGVYFLHVSQGSKAFNKKIIIQ